MASKLRPFFPFLAPRSSCSGPLHSFGEEGTIRVRVTITGRVMIRTRFALGLGLGKDREFRWLKECTESRG